MPSQEVEDARLGYQTAANLVGLVSAEIYSRFGAMLTANSIIIAIMGWILTSEHRFPMILALFIPTMGVILCCIWLSFLKHGYYFQSLFREIARQLEERYFSETFRIFSLLPVIRENPQALGNIPPFKKGLPIPSMWVNKFPFYRTSQIVVFIVMSIHIAVFLRIITSGQ